MYAHNFIFIMYIVHNISDSGYEEFSFRPQPIAGQPNIGLCITRSTLEISR
jgi:hypothetical protein